MKIIKYITLVFFIYLTSCNHNILFENNLTEVILINEIQDCEELNMHYKIISENYYGRIVLPFLTNEMNNKKNNTIFFKAFDTVRKEIKVKGYFSKNKHNEIDIGCIGAYYFKVDTILSVKKSNLEFKINNK